MAHSLPTPFRPGTAYRDDVGAKSSYSSDCIPKVGQHRRADWQAGPVGTWTALPI